MAPVSTLHFGPFALDGTDDGLWCGPERCKLTAKAEAVLRYLVAHPGRLVRKADLLATVWPDVHVSDWVLTTCIREIRHVLGDVARAPVHCDRASARVSVHCPGNGCGYARAVVQRGAPRAPACCPPACEALPVCSHGCRPGGGTQAGDHPLRGAGRGACPGGTAGPRAVVSPAPDGSGADPGGAAALRRHPHPGDQ